MLAIRRKVLLVSLCLMLLTGCGAMQAVKCSLWPLFDCPSSR